MTHRAARIHARQQPDTLRRSRLESTATCQPAHAFGNIGSIQVQIPAAPAATPSRQAPPKASSSRRHPNFSASNVSLVDQSERSRQLAADLPDFYLVFIIISFLCRSSRSSAVVPARLRSRLGSHLIFTPTHRPELTNGRRQQWQHAESDTLPALRPRQLYGAQALIGSDGVAGLARTAHRPV